MYAREISRDRFRYPARFWHSSKARCGGWLGDVLATSTSQPMIGLTPALRAAL
jgi:hypothetical protein